MTHTLSELILIYRHSKYFRGHQKYIMYSATWMHHIFKSSPVADLGEGPAKPLFWVKQQNFQKEEKLVGQVKHTPLPPPPLHLPQGVDLPPKAVFGKLVEHSLARLIK